LRNQRDLKMFRTTKTEGPSGTSGRTTTGFDTGGGGGGGGEDGWAGAGGDGGDNLVRLADEGALEDSPFDRGERNPRLKGKDMVV
jgi:hypothetical protein